MEKFLKPQVYLPVIYIVIGVIVYFIGQKIIDHIFKPKKGMNNSNVKRMNTLRILIRNIYMYVVILVVILAVLTAFGINIQSVLAGLGIAGLIIGLAVQDIIKDFLSGMAIVLENQFSIGDVIQVGTFKGEVIFIGLRTTRIKDNTGAIKILANRNINDIINYSIALSLASVSIPVSYDTDVLKCEKVLNDLAKKLSTELKDVRSDVEIAGIDKVDNQAIIYRMTAKTLPLKQYFVESEMRRFVKEALDDANITITRG